MILTCPECASRYFVDDAKVGPEGRNVRCANCSHRWHAAAPPPRAPEPEPEPAVELPDDLAFVEPAAAEAPAEEAEPPAVAEPAAVEPPAIEPLTPARPRVAKAKGGALASGLIWAALAIVLGAIVAAVVVFRADVVRAVPRTASAYAAIGLPVNAVGLVIEDIRARPSLQDGHAVLTVTGVLRNVEGREVMAPPLRISLLNPDGKTVAGKIAAADDPLIPAGESRHFAVDLLDPPSTSKDLEVSFVLDGARPEAVTTAVPAPAEPAHAEPDPAGAASAAEAPRLRGAPVAEGPHAAPAPAAEHH